MKNETDLFRKTRPVRRKVYRYNGKKNDDIVLMTFKTNVGHKIDFINFCRDQEINYSAFFRSCMDKLLREKGNMEFLKK